MGLLDANARNAEKLLLVDTIFFIEFIQILHNYDITITCDTDNFAFQTNASFFLHWVLIKIERV